MGIITMLEASKYMENDRDRAVVEIIASHNPILERLPFKTITGPGLEYSREGKLPGVAFRGVNEDYSTTVGVINPQVEFLRIFGGLNKTDVAQVAMAGGQADLRGENMSMFSKSMSLSFMKWFFDGNNEDNPREFDGLNRRLVNDQSLTMNSGGGTLTLDKIDNLIDAVSGSVAVLLMNKVMQRKVTKLGQAANNVSFGVDALGRRITEYAGIPIGIVEDDNENNAILGFDEDDGQGNLDTTSIYAVRFGPDGILGIQNAPITTRDNGLVGNDYVDVIEWIASFAAKHPKAAARLSRINNA